MSRSVTAATADPVEYPVQSGPICCAEAFAELPQGLAATYWGERSVDDPDAETTVRFAGVRPDGAGGMVEREAFAQTVTVGGLPAGSGRFALTNKIVGVGEGVWNVSAVRLSGGGTRDLPQRAQLHTRPTLFVFGPGVRPWSWPLLVGIGALLAGVVQGALLARSGTNVAAASLVTLVGCVLGFVGAKSWYLAVKRQHPRNFLTAGACIQGFLLVAVVVLAIGGAVTHIGTGRLLDATTPGLFLGMAIGRPGCFLTGCCAGRPTASRWGLWSSDRRIAVRRIPVQLWEAFAALVIGLVTLVVTVATTVPEGTLFVGATAAYTAVRQLLFPFRADPHTRRGRRLTLTICIVVLVGDMVLVAVG